MRRIGLQILWVLVIEFPKRKMPREFPIRYKGYVHRVQRCFWMRMLSIGFGFGDNEANLGIGNLWLPRRTHLLIIVRTTQIIILCGARITYTQSKVFFKCLNKIMLSTCCGDDLWLPRRTHFLIIIKTTQIIILCRIYHRLWNNYVTLTWPLV